MSIAVATAGDFIYMPFSQPTREGYYNLFSDESSGDNPALLQKTRVSGIA
jgi:hypothetical protein